jgi:hypothetical protein
MTIDTLVAKLLDIRKTHGDLEAKITWEMTVHEITDKCITVEEGVLFLDGEEGWRYSDNRWKQ